MSIRKLARQLSLAPSTVSLALRNAPNISPATCERVIAAADMMGYQVNPAVRAAMASARAGRQIKARFSVAFLHDLSRYGNATPHSYYAACVRRVKEIGDSMGFDVYTLDYAELGSNIASVERVLNARGIRLVLVGKSAYFYPDFKLGDKFAVVAIGDGYAGSAHRVYNDVRTGTRDGYFYADKRGAQRVGLVSKAPVGSPLYQEYLGPYLTEEYLRHGKINTPVHIGRNVSLESVAAWIAENSVDYIITSTNWVLEWHSELKGLLGVHWINGILGTRELEPNQSYSLNDVDAQLSLALKWVDQLNYRNDFGPQRLWVRSYVCDNTADPRIPNK